MNRELPAPQPWSYRAWMISVLALFFGIALAPVGVAFFHSLCQENGFTLSAYQQVLGQTRQWTLLGNTVAVAVCSTFLATGIGTVLALSIEYLRVPCRRLLFVGGVIPLLIPNYVMAVAGVEVFGSNGLLQAAVNRIAGAVWVPPSLNNVGGVVLVLALSYYPVILLTTRHALQRMDARFEEAARLAAGPGRSFRCIVLPLLGPSIMIGAVMVFLLSLVSFSVPSLLQVNVYSVDVFTTFNAFYDTSAAMAQSLPLLGLGLSALLAGDRYLKSRRCWLSGAVRPCITPRGTPILRLMALIGGGVIVGFSSIVPIMVLIWRSLPWTTYAETFSTAWGEIGTSFIVASVSATIITGLGFSLACIDLWHVHQRSRLSLRRRIIPGLCIVPFLVSGPVLGAAFIALWNRPGFPGMIYDSLLILVLVCVARFIFFAERGFAASMADMDQELVEAARVLGISWWRILLRIIWPLSGPTAVGVWGLSFLFTFGEIDATALLCPPGGNTLTMRIFSLMHYGPGPMVAALCVITVALILLCAAAVALAYGYVMRRNRVRQRGVHACD